MTLADFLAARLDEDEAVARNVPKWDTWVWPTSIAYSTVGYDTDEVLQINPARVLAEVAAKRNVLELASDLISSLQAQDHGTAVLMCLAVPYADHPDYDESWRA